MVNRVIPKRHPRFSLRVHHHQPSDLPLTVNDSSQTVREKKRRKKRRNKTPKKERRPVLKIHSRSRTNLDR